MKKLYHIFSISLQFEILLLLKIVLRKYGFEDHWGGGGGGGDCPFANFKMTVRRFVFCRDSDENKMIS